MLAATFLEMKGREFIASEECVVEMTLALAGWKLKQAASRAAYLFVIRIIPRILGAEPVMRTFAVRRKLLDRGCLAGTFIVMKYAVAILVFICFSAITSFALMIEIEVTTETADHLPINISVNSLKRDGGIELTFVVSNKTYQVNGPNPSGARLVTPKQSLIPLEEETFKTWRRYKCLIPNDQLDSVFHFTFWPERGSPYDLSLKVRKFVALRKLPLKD